MRINVKLRNKILDSGFGDAFDGGTLQIYSGSAPATPNLAPTGTLLATIPLAADSFGAAVNGSVAKNGAWETTGAAAGDAAWARFSEAGDDDSLDGNFYRADVSVTATGGGGELQLINTNIATGQPVSVSSFTFTMPQGE